MSNVDQEFIKDLNQCLHLADELSKLNTEESKLFVSEQLNELHTFLQKKQNDAESRIEEEMRKEEEEIEQLKKRIERAATSNGESESDIAYTDLNILWTNLKDEYWQLAFNAFIRETKQPVKEILENLIAILMACFSKCKDRATQIRTDMKFQVYFPGENPTNKNYKIPQDKDQDLDSLCRRCQLRSTPFCISSVREVIVSDVRAMSKISKHFKYKSKELSKEIEKFANKCVEFCWVAVLEEPEIHLITNPKKECLKIANEFVDLELTIYKAREGASYVQWPAIVQGGKVRVQWQLYPMKAPRPEPKDLRGEQSVDYRVAGVEDNDGKLKDDPDDAVKEEESTSSFQSNNGADKVDDKSCKVKTEGLQIRRRGNVKEKTEEKDKKIEYKKPPKGHENTQF